MVNEKVFNLRYIWHKDAILCSSSNLNGFLHVLSHTEEVLNGPPHVKVWITNTQTFFLLFNKFSRGCENPADGRMWATKTTVFLGLSPPTLYWKISIEHFLDWKREKSNVMMMQGNFCFLCLIKNRNLLLISLSFPSLGSISIILNEVSTSASKGSFNVTL